MTLAALAVINIYPIWLVRNNMMDSARAEMQASGQLLAAALSGYSELTSEKIHDASLLLDSAANKRVLVLSSYGIVLTDSQRSTEFLGKLFLPPVVTDALDGLDSFRHQYTGRTLVHKAALPIVKDDEIIGVIYFYRLDGENAQLLNDVRDNLLRITTAGMVLFGCCIIFFNIAMGRRFATLLSGIAAVGKGDYDYQIYMRGHDELTDIADRFNDMSRTLKKTEIMRRQFVSDASHELKTPLASIKLLSDSVIQNQHVSEENLREFVGDIGDEIQRLIVISESLLSLSRLDDSPDRQRICCDLRQNIFNCVEMLRGSCEHYSVTIHTDIRGEFYVLGTNEGMFHIVFNLLENAVKYNQPGGNVWIKLSRLGDQVILLVRDDGIGIPGEDMPKIFDRFYRVDKARSRETGGTGLGLSIVREWVSDLGGHIEVKSQPEKGSTFKVTLVACEKENINED